MTALTRRAPTGIEAGLVEISPHLVELGARYDAAPVFPDESLRALARIGLHRRFASLGAGGGAFADTRMENAALLEALRHIGRADLSLGRLFEGHVNALKLFGWYGTTEQQRRLAQDLAVGRFYGVWATEPQPGVRLERTGAGWRLRGRKSFASGAGSLARALITTTTAAGERQLVIVAGEEQERADLSGWRVRGMRATLSGFYDLTGLEPRASDLLGAIGDYGREPRFTAGAWRFCAVQLGGAEALLSELRAAMSPAACQDPVRRGHFADAVAAARGAYLWVREAAMRVADETADAAPFVLMTRGVVERAALAVMEIATRMVGTRSAFDGERIDKIVRDLSLYLRQADPDGARDRAARAWLDHDAWGNGDRLW